MSKVKKLIEKFESTNKLGKKTRKVVGDVRVNNKENQSEIKMAFEIEGDLKKINSDNIESEISNEVKTMGLNPKNVSFIKEDGVVFLNVDSDDLLNMAQKTGQSVTKILSTIINRRKENE